MQNDLYWYDEKEEGYFMTPCFKGLDYVGCPSEDKFVMTSETGKQFENSVGLYDNSEGFETEASIDYLDKPCLFNVMSMNDKNEALATDSCHFDKRNQPEGGIEGHGLCKCCAGAGGMDPVDFIYLSSKETDLGDFQLKVGDIPTDSDIAPIHIESMNTNCSSKRGSRSDWIEGIKNASEIIPNGIDNYELDSGEVNGESHELNAATDEEAINADELLMYDAQEDEYEVFNLRIIHRKNRFVADIPFAKPLVV